MSKQGRISFTNTDAFRLLLQTELSIRLLDTDPFGNRRDWEGRDELVAFAKRIRKRVCKTGDYRFAPLYEKTDR